MSRKALPSFAQVMTDEAVCSGRGTESTLLLCFQQGAECCLAVSLILPGVQEKATGASGDSALARILPGGESLPGLCDSHPETCQAMSSLPLT